MVIGVAKDAEQAASWYRRAAEAGHTEARRALEQYVDRVSDALDAESRDALTGLGWGGGVQSSSPRTQDWRSSSPCARLASLGRRTLCLWQGPDMLLLPPRGPSQWIQSGLRRDTPAARGRAASDAQGAAADVPRDGRRGGPRCVPAWDNPHAAQPPHNHTPASPPLQAQGTSASPRKHTTQLGQRSSSDFSGALSFGPGGCHAGRGRRTRLSRDSRLRGEASGLAGVGAAAPGS